MKRSLLTSSKRMMSSMPCTVHSTFRDEFGTQVKPHGLDWHVKGESHIAYTSTGTSDTKQLAQEADTPEGRQSIVEAHNRWCFAKDLPFRKAEEIEKVYLAETGTHVRVQWKEYTENGRERYTIQDVEKIIAADKSAIGEAPPAPVWINGYLYGLLSPKTLPEILEAIQNTPSTRKTFTKINGIIRIERRFVGMIRGQDVFDHLLDNLYATEDPEIIDERTLIGTATLPDWIMGGKLTSRVWIRELENGNLLCLRPLYNDDINTKDRKYELVKGNDTEKIGLVKMELERLRHLATLPSPIDESLLEENGGREEKKEPLTEPEEKSTQILWTVMY